MHLVLRGLVATVNLEQECSRILLSITVTYIREIMLIKSTTLKMLVVGG